MSTKCFSKFGVKFGKEPQPDLHPTLGTDHSLCAGPQPPTSELDMQLNTVKAENVVAATEAD